MWNDNYKDSKNKELVGGVVLYGKIAGKTIDYGLLRPWTITELIYSSLCPGAIIPRIGECTLQ